MIFASVSFNPKAIFRQTVKDFECNAKIYDLKVYCFCSFGRGRTLLAAIRWLRRRSSTELFLFSMQFFHNLKFCITITPMFLGTMENKHVFLFSSCLVCRLIHKLSYITLFLQWRLHSMCRLIRSSKFSPGMSAKRP